MRFLGLRVVGTDGNLIGFGTALIRWLGLVLSLGVVLLGVIWVAFDPDKQGWHDKIARTYVVFADARSDRADRRRRLGLRAVDG